MADESVAGPVHGPELDLSGLDRLIADWRERARRVRPLECAPVSAEKRARVTEWLWYTNRANELEAELRRRRPGAPTATDPALDPALQEVFQKLAAQQRDLDPAAAKILRDHLWALYDSGAPPDRRTT